MIPMNLLLGGAVIAAVTSLRREREAVYLHRWLESLLPVAALWTLVTGFVSLQVLNLFTAPQPRFFADMDGEMSEIVGMLPHAAGYREIWPLLDLVLFTAVAVALLYLGRLAGRSRRGLVPGSATGWTAAILVAVAALLCVNAQNSDERNITDLAPPPLLPLFALLSGEAGEIQRIVSAGTSLVPRLLHLLIGAVAVAGMMVAVHGILQRRRDAAYAQWATKHGALWLAAPTAIQLAVGSWFLVALPEPVRSRFLGGSMAATAELIVGILLAVAVLILITQAGSVARPAPLVWAGAASLSLLLLVMILLREQARYGYLTESYEMFPESGRSMGQIAAAAGLLMVAAALFAVWLIRRLRTAPQAA
jgi:hypothetical protein